MSAQQSPLTSISPQAIEDLSRAHIVCVGDVMLDRFIYGDVARISPEAPVPVFAIDREELMLGGAGNVARNIISLGAKVSFISVVGDDDTGHALTKALGEEEAIEPFLLTEPGRMSGHKIRYVAGGQQMMRADQETKAAIQDTTASKLLEATRDALAGADALLLSDYAKGVLTPETVRQLIALANELGKPCMIDPKHHDFSLYQSATMVSPNLKELTAACPLDTDLSSMEAITQAAETLRKNSGITHLLVTLGAQGMLLISETETHHYPAHPCEVYDVSGAGDTTIATLATAYASGLALPDAAYLANRAAGIVVGRLGTATIYRTDLKTAMHTDSALQSKAKIMPLTIAQDQIANWRRDGYRIGFTNGCYDIMHAGHMEMLEQCATHCDKLIVAVNSDDSVRRLKGDERPINQEMDRAMLIAGLGCVDAVVIFRDDTPMELITSMKPDVLMKGADYTKDQVVGGEEVEAYGGEITLIPLKEGYSTTNIVEKLRSSS